ncbi:hypothetical protein ACHMW5_07895 (plasmid) [Azospirillum melinis]|uniref:hypothetical protein n=1 Tax=Azospirillum melinis TaxID=328839 RepID=UPI003756734B
MISSMPTTMPPTIGLPTMPGQVDYVLHDAEGRIRQVGICARDVLDRQAHGQSDLAVLEAKAHHLTDYVDLTGETPEVRARPTISGLDRLPSGAMIDVTCTVTGATNSYSVDDGSFEYTDMPGVYRVKVSRFPYLDFVTEIRL